MPERSMVQAGIRAVRERTIIRNVYLWMTLGLILTGVVALGFASTPGLVISLVKNPILFFGLIVGELLLVFFLSARIMHLSPAAATLGFAGYSVLNGVTLSLIFLAYTGASITSALFITAGMFAGMSLYATLTKRDLSSMGHYLIMGLWGIIIASIVNIFLKSTFFYWLVSYAGVALFLGLTAYDTQMIKKMSDQIGDNVSEADYLRLSILGALKLYLDFINLFLFILRIFGRRR